MPPQIRNLIIITAVVLGSILLYATMAPQQNSQEVSFSTFVNLVEQGQVADCIIKGAQVRGRTHNGEVFVVTIPRYYGNLVPMLYEKGVNFRIESGESQGLFFAILSSWLPIILIIGVWIFFMRQMQGGNRVMNFGKSKAKMLDENAPRVTFADVAGIDESKAELDEIVDFLKDPSKFDRLGGKIPTGVLLVGEPGTGKTMLAKAIAGEAGTAFLSISGSDFVEMFVGVGASRVRDLFTQARANAPCIVFIDEIDAVGRQRGAGLGGGNDEREQTLNQLLVEMDGFNGNDGVIVVAATNRPDVLDTALTRPGRFDRQVHVSLPDIKGRQEILAVHVKKIRLEENTDLSTIARGTPGFSGADLANLVNESALHAARLNKDAVTLEDMEWARDKVMMGTERKSMIMTEAEKRQTAFHEAGHALVAAYTAKADPVHKITIIPRGQALGLTSFLPEKDRLSLDLAGLKARIAVSMGGMAAESMTMQQTSSGVEGDLRSATDLAYRMVCSWGMSKHLGALVVPQGDTGNFLAMDYNAEEPVSEEMQQKVDGEVKEILEECYTQAMGILQEHKNQLEALTELLVSQETVTAGEFMHLLGRSDDLQAPAEA